MSKQAGQKLLITLQETRAALMDAFGEAPKCLLHQPVEEKFPAMPKPRT